MKAPFLLSGILLLSACEVSPGDDPSSSEPPGAYVHAVNQSIYGNPAALRDGRSVEELNALIRQNIEAGFELDPVSGESYRSLFRAPRPLSEKDAAASRLLDAHPGLEWLHLRQSVAAELLELHLRNGSDDLDAIARYTAVLLEAENPSADLIAEALPLLADRWTEAERREAAGASLRAATDWLSMTCTDCPARRASHAAAASGEFEAKRRAVSDAVGRLSDLAGR